LKIDFDDVASAGTQVGGLIIVFNSDACEVTLNLAHDDISEENLLCVEVTLPNAQALVMNCNAFIV